MYFFRKGNGSLNILLMLIVMIAALSLFAGCEGKEGPMGPAGANGTTGQDGQDGADGQDGDDGQAGDDGQDGEDGQDGDDGQDGEDGAGSRVIYEGTVNANPFVVITPQISLADMPAVSVYISFDLNGLDWYEIPRYWDIDYPYTESYNIHEGSVEIFYCNGWKFKVVIII